MSLQRGCSRFGITQLATRRLSSNDNNNKNTDRKGGRPSITFLHAAHNFLPIKISMTEQESSDHLSIYRTFHHSGGGGSAGCRRPSPCLR